MESVKSSFRRLEVLRNSKQRRPISCSKPRRQGHKPPPSPDTKTCARGSMSVSCFLPYRRSLTWRLHYGWDDADVHSPGVTLETWVTLSPVNMLLGNHVYIVRLGDSGANLHFQYTVNCVSMLLYTHLKLIGGEKSVCARIQITDMVRSEWKTLFFFWLWKVCLSKWQLCFSHYPFSYNLLSFSSLLEQRWHAFAVQSNKSDQNVLIKAI